MDERMHKILLSKLNVTQVKTLDIHKTLKVYNVNILNTENIESLELVTRQLPLIDLTKSQVKKEAFLLQEVSLAVISLIQNQAIVNKEEKSYRTYFVQMICTAIKNYLDSSVIFFPAEAPLNAMSKYLKAHKLVQTDCESYKADGIFQYETFELCINEISGPFNHSLRSKYQFDFHKAMYGCMAVIWDIIQNYHYATCKTFEELNVYFLHCKKNSIQLWSLSFSSGIFVMHRKRKTVISSSFDYKSQTIHQLMFLIHTVKVKLEEAIQVITKMKKEHSNFINSLLVGENKKKDRPDLREVVSMTIHKLTEAHDSNGLFEVDPISIGEFEEDTVSFLETL